MRTGVQQEREKSHEWGHDLLLESARKVQNPKNGLCLMARAQSVRGRGGQGYGVRLQGEVSVMERREDMCA